MRYNDLQDKCKECEYMKPYALEMDGNHGCVCKKHQFSYFHKMADECNEYKINLETEYAQPVVHAKWIDRKDYHSCSNCEAVLEDYKWHYYAYCYHCGARMDGD